MLLFSFKAYNQIHTVIHILKKGWTMWNIASLQLQLPLNYFPAFTSEAKMLSSRCRRSSGVSNSATRPSLSVRIVSEFIIVATRCWRRTRILERFANSIITLNCCFFIPKSYRLTDSKPTKIFDIWDNVNSIRSIDGLLSIWSRSRDGLKLVLYMIIHTAKRLQTVRYWSEINGLLLFIVFGLVWVWMEYY